MALTAYTTYADIRALLGVATTEIRDTVLAGSTFEQQLLLEMEDIDGGVGAVKVQFDTITAIQAGSRTTDQARFLTLVSLFAAYSVARQLLGSVEMFAPMKITDGSAEIQRDKNPYARLVEAINASYTMIRKRLSDLLLVLVPAANVAVASPRTYISSVGIALDPVTGV